jgi:hypothetical protein
VHRLEERELCWVEPGRQSGTLAGYHPGPDVRAELADLRAPPGCV